MGLSPTSCLPCHVSFAMGLSAFSHRALVSRSRVDEYAGSLIDRYRDAVPVWVLLEVVPFGAMLAFYLFCVERWEEGGEPGDSLLSQGRESRSQLRESCGLPVQRLRARARDEARILGGRARVTERPRHSQQQGPPSKAAQSSHAAAHDHRGAVDMLAGDHAAPAAFDAVAGLRSLMDDAIARYGTQNPLVSPLAFLARVFDVAQG